MKLNSDRECLILENEKLIKFTLKRMGILRDNPEYEDFFSIGRIGLIKAADSFKVEMNCQFSTYAVSCIRYEILNYFRKTRNEPKNNLSLSEIVKGTEDLIIEDIIEDPRLNFEDSIEERDIFVRAVDIILNYFCGKDRLIMLYFLSNITQAEIAKRLKISRVYITKRILNNINKICKLVNEPRRYSKVFSMLIQDDFYRITFLSKEVNQLKKIISSLSANTTSIDEVPNFEVLCNEERIVINVQAHPKSFIFIAKIVQKIDEYDIKLIDYDNAQLNE